MILLNAFKKRVSLLLILFAVLFVALTSFGVNAQAATTSHFTTSALIWWVAEEPGTLIPISAAGHNNTFETYTWNDSTITLTKHSDFAYVESWPYPYDLYVMAGKYASYYDDVGTYHGTSYLSYDSNVLPGIDWVWDNQSGTSTISFFSGTPVLSNFAYSSFICLDALNPTNSLYSDVYIF